MKIHVATLSLSGQQQQFSGMEELNAALSQSGIVGVEKQFFMTGDTAHYAFVITYDGGREATALPVKGFRSSSGKQKQHYPTQAEVLAAIPPERRGLYDLLREVRNAKAKELGKKGYLLANNYQLAHIVCKAPQSLTALRRIRDLGEEFCTTCGDVILEKVNGLEPVELNAPEGAWWADMVGRDAPTPPDGDGRGDLTNRPQRPLYQSGPTRGGRGATRPTTPPDSPDSQEAAE